MRIVVYYAVWVTLCAAVAGVVMAFIHTAFFSYHPGRSGVMQTLFDGVVTALAIAAGQGAVALLMGSILARLGYLLQATVLLGLLVGVFDFIMYFVQTAVPVAELGWVPDLTILTVVTAIITGLGARRPTAA
jgi:hypothetical protein